MIGERIGNFNVVSQLGRGGMGEVYLGEHEKIGTRVAVKVLQPHISSNKDHVERFFNEAIAVSKIQHSGIGKIFDVGFHGERAYLVMEFLAGETLATRIRRLGKLPLGHVCELGRQISGVLESVHNAGITHRDLKPDNIFIVPDEELPGGERIKIVDFGIAKLSGAGPGLTATNSGSMGTPAYMSPEQWKNSKAVDWRADAYSLGCLTFEMIAGRPPFIAETIGEACSLHLTEEAPRLGALVVVPAPLDALIANLLAKLPEQRPPSMRDIANAFAAIGQGVGLGTSDTLSAAAMALGATLPSNPPQVTPNMATQVTSAPQTNRTMPAPPPSMHQTTLGGATGSKEIAAAKPPKKRRWIWGVAGIAVVAIVAGVAIIANGIYRSTSTQVVNINANTGSGSGSNVAAGSAAPGSVAPGSGSSVAAKPTTAELRKELLAAVARCTAAPRRAECFLDAARSAEDASVAYRLAREAVTACRRESCSKSTEIQAERDRLKDAAERSPNLTIIQLEIEIDDVAITSNAGSGSGRPRARVPGREGPPINNTTNAVASNTEDTTALPKVTPPVLSKIRPLYPQLIQCGKDHDATGMLITWTLRTKPDGTVSSMTFVATRDRARVSTSAALETCLTTVFKSVSYGRSREGGSSVNAVLIR